MARIRDSRYGQGLMVLMWAAVSFALASGCAGPAPWRPLIEPRDDPEGLKASVLLILEYVQGDSNWLALRPTSQASSGLRWISKTDEARIDAIRDVAREMRGRHVLIEDVKQRGYAKEDERGYLCVEAALAEVSCSERNALQCAVAAENEDRKNLYQALARVARTLDVATVENAFAHVRLTRSGNHTAPSILAPS